jgi:hypothetical protein
MNSRRRSKLSDLITKRDNYCCCCCNYDDKLTLHHIIPQSNGGSNRYGNIICVCESCHVQIHKNTLNDIMFIPSLDARTSRILVFREIIACGVPSSYTSGMCYIKSIFKKLPKIPEHPSIHQRNKENDRI